MNSQEMLRALKEQGFHLSIINIATGIPYHRLDRCKVGTHELKESEYKLLLEFFEINNKERL